MAKGHPVVVDIEVILHVAGILFAKRYFCQLKTLSLEEEAVELQRADFSLSRAVNNVNQSVLVCFTHSHDTIFGTGQTLSHLHVGGIRTDELQAQPGIVSGLLEGEDDALAVGIVGERYRTDALHIVPAEHTVVALVSHHIATVALCRIKILLGGTDKVGVSVAKSLVGVIAQLDLSDFRAIVAVNPEAVVAQGGHHTVIEDVAVEHLAVDIVCVSHSVGVAATALEPHAVIVLEVERSLSLGVGALVSYHDAVVKVGVGFVGLCGVEFRGGDMESLVETVFIAILEAVARHPVGVKHEAGIVTLGRGDCLTLLPQHACGEIALFNGRLGLVVSHDFAHLFGMLVVDKLHFHHGVPISVNPQTVGGHLGGTHVRLYLESIGCVGQDVVNPVGIGRVVVAAFVPFVGRVKEYEVGLSAVIGEIDADFVAGLHCGHICGLDPERLCGIGAVFRHVIPIIGHLESQALDFGHTRECAVIGILGSFGIRLLAAAPTFNRIDRGDGELIGHKFELL